MEKTSLPDKLKKLVRKEPVAVAAGIVITVLVTYGVSAGVIDESLAPLILAAASLILGVPLATTVRSKVTPAANLPKVAKVYTDAALAEARSRAIGEYGAQGGDLVDAVSEEVNKYLGRHRAK